jgi:hypothetical protein
MNLKCIGGPNHGKYINIDVANFRIGDEIRVAIPKPFKVDLTIHPNKPIIDDIEIYIIDMFRYRNSDMWRFLRYKHNTIPQTLDILFK